jgi:hypothetical protein
MLNLLEGRQRGTVLSRWNFNNFFTCANYVSDAKDVNARAKTFEWQKLRLVHNQRDPQPHRGKHILLSRKK